MRVVVVGKFSMSYRIRPQDGVISTEDLKVRFNFLVDSLCFSVGLGMVGSRQGEIVV